MNDPVRQEKPRWLLWMPILVAAAAVLVASIVRWRRRQRMVRPPLEKPPAPLVIPPSLRGLTEVEAAARRVEGQDNTIYLQPPRSRPQILRENLLTIFNLNLVGLGFVQFLLGLPLDGLLSLGMIFVNAALNIGQEMLARIRVKQVEEATRLKATVIRDGKVRSVDPNEVVQGDMLVAGPGDQLLVDGELVGEGQLLVDEGMLTGERSQVAKRPGDPVLAGTFCVSGRAVYEAQRVGNERLIVTRLSTSQTRKMELTPLEHVIDRVLRVLLIVVAVLTALLLSRYLRLDLGIPVEDLAGAASVIFSLAPASLFFMIFLTYAAGTADLAKLGALVHRARSVESLASANSLCFAKEGILTGTYVRVEPIEPPSGQEQLAASRIDQILGDYVRSTSLDNLSTRAMIATFTGSQRRVREEAPFLSVYGWCAISFDEDDLRGTYVLGEPQILEDHLVTESEEPTEVDSPSSPLGALRTKLPSLGRFLRRSKAEPQEEDTEPATEEVETGPVHPEPLSSEPLPVPPEAQPAGETMSTEDKAPRPNLFRRISARVRTMIPRRKPTLEEIESSREPDLEETVLLFAYRSEISPLHTPDGSPQLPQQLIPLCTVRYSEQVRPEAIETIRAFSQSGVQIKIFSSGPPDRTAALLKGAGFAADGKATINVISGAELAEVDPERLGQAALENTVFGHVTPEQSAQVVQALREQGQMVTVVGDGVSDVMAMRQANLSIARHGSSQAALSVADIVLVKDSPKVLLDVLSKGQRVANGLLDVLKLYLTQILYLLLLIIAIRLFATGFPYQSKQGSIITIVTLSIPSAGLSLWAAAGLLPTRNLRWLLMRFVAPAALTIGAAGLLMYLVFLGRTGTVAYAQLALTYTLVPAGLLLVLFLRPPTRLWVGGAPLSGDRRFTVVIIILLVAFFLLPAIPLARELFLLDWLRQPSDYALVGATIVGWAVLLRAIWWAMPRVIRQERGLAVPDALPV